MQRVAEARVVVAGAVQGEIGPGLCVLLGVAQGDEAADAERLGGKVARLRVFENEAGKFDRSLLEVGGSALVVVHVGAEGGTNELDSGTNALVSAHVAAEALSASGVTALVVVHPSGEPEPPPLLSRFASPAPITGARSDPAAARLAADPTAARFAAPEPRSA